MRFFMNKKELSIFLSKLRTFDAHKLKLEQYATECNIAGEALWTAYMHGHINGKKVADLGCGHGILGLGALLLGAIKVHFIDIDPHTLHIAAQNIATAENLFHKTFAYELNAIPVPSFTQNVDTVIMNPPFGAQQEHADRPFLETAFAHANYIYSFHMLETRSFIESFAHQHYFSATLLNHVMFPLSRTQTFHTKNKHYIDVGLWLFKRRYDPHEGQ